MLSLMMVNEINIAPSPHIPPFASVLERTAWVQGALKVRGLTFAALARRHGWSRTMVAAAMRQPLDAQEKAIADALGVEQRTLFPERFRADGSRLHLVRKNKDEDAVRNVKNKRGA